MNPLPLKVYHDNQWIDVRELMCEDIVSSTFTPVELPSVNIYPNPVTPGDVLQVSSGSFRIDEVRLVSLADGREVLHQRFMPTFERGIAVPTVPPGVYLVRVRTVTGLEGVGKVVIR